MSFCLSMSEFRMHFLIEEKLNEKGTMYFTLHCTTPHKTSVHVPVLVLQLLKGSALCCNVFVRTYAYNRSEDTPRVSKEQNSLGFQTPVNILQR